MNTDHTYHNIQVIPQNLTLMLEIMINKCNPLTPNFSYVKSIKTLNFAIYLNKTVVMSHKN